MSNFQPYVSIYWEGERLIYLITALGLCPSLFELDPFDHSHVYVRHVEAFS